MPDPPAGLSAQRNSNHPVCTEALRSTRTSGPPPPLATVPSVTSEYCVAGGAMLQLAVALWPSCLPMASPPVFLNPEYPGNGYQRSPSSRGSSAPTKIEESWVPDEEGAAPADQEVM